MMKALLKDRTTRTLRLRRNAREDTGQSTFIIEAMLLLLCVLIVVAVSMTIFAFSSAKGDRAYYESKALAMAANRAEVFAARPWDADVVMKSEGCILTCAVTRTDTGSGSLYSASIVVTKDDDTLYELETARYVSDTGNHQLIGPQSGEGDL